MPNIMWLFALLVAVPIIEIALFIQVGGVIGLFPTLAIVIATALAGTVLLRRQGLATLSKLQSSVAEGRNPMNPIAHGAMILVSGVLLLTPGFFTDAVGLLLLVPGVRAALIKAGAARMAEGKMSFATFSTQNAHPGPGSQPGSQPRPHPGQRSGPTTIDGEFEHINDPDGPAGNSGWTKRP